MILESILLQKFNGSIAVIEDEKERTYAEFAEHVYRSATFFRRNNITKLLIDLPQGFHSYAIMWGAYISGVIFCPINNISPDARKEYFILQFEPDLIISNVNYLFETSCKFKVRPSVLFLISLQS